MLHGNSNIKYENISSFESPVTKQRHNVTFQKTLIFRNATVKNRNLATDNFAAIWNWEATN